MPVLPAAPALHKRKIRYQIRSLADSAKPNISSTVLGVGSGATGAAPVRGEWEATYDVESKRKAGAVGGCSPGRPG